MLCSARGTQLKATIEAFRALFGKDLEKVIKKETSFAFEKLLVEVLKCQRPDWGVDHNSMVTDIDALYKATEGKLGTDEKVNSLHLSYSISQYSLFKRL